MIRFILCGLKSVIEPNAMPTVSPFAIRLLLLAMFLSVLGCSRSAADLPLDEQRAEEVLRLFLDHWKSGKEAADLETARPGLIVGDVDWKNRVELVDYSILPEKLNDGTNLHLTASLSLKRDGRSSTANITYVVGTSPVETIFRK